MPKRQGVVGELWSQLAIFEGEINLESRSLIGSLAAGSRLFVVRMGGLHSFWFADARHAHFKIFVL